MAGAMVAGVRAFILPKPQLDTASMSACFFKSMAISFQSHLMGVTNEHLLTCFKHRLYHRLPQCGCQSAQVCKMTACHSYLAAWCPYARRQWVYLIVRYIVINKEGINDFLIQACMPLHSLIIP